MSRALFMFVCLFSWCGSAVSQKRINVLDFGAVGDNATLNTSSIQKAIDKASTRNGGIVFFPAGKFLSGTLVLRSGVQLYLDKNAELIGSIDPEHYAEAGRTYGLIIASDEENISINGKGTIDGQGLKLALVLDSLHHAGVRVDENYNYRRMRPAKRPMILDFNACKNVRISGITLKDSPFWVQNYTDCENVAIDSVIVNSVAFWNNDGIDISGCRNVRITHCRINAADDGICLKSERKDHINADVYIGHCTIRTSASAIKFGTASFGDFRDIVIENIDVYDTYRSAIALESVDGGTIENVQIRNVNANKTGNPIFIRLGHRNKNSPPGSIKNISIKNVRADVPFDRPDQAYDLRGPDLPFFHNPFPSSIVGIPGYKIENVSIEDVEIIYPGRATKGMAYIPLWRMKDVPECEGEYPEFSMFGELPAWAFYVRHADHVKMKNISVKLADKDFRPAIVFDDTHNIALDHINLPPESDSDKIILHNSDVQVCDPATGKKIRPL